MRKLFLYIIIAFLYSLCNLSIAQSGSIDSTFGMNGIAQITISTNQSATCTNLIPLSSGKLIATGFVDNGAGSDFALTRLFDNGAIDSTFGLNGIVITTIFGSGAGKSYSSIVQPDGKIVLGGEYYYIFGYFAAVRYNPDGTLDSSFGNGGIAIKNVSNFLVHNNGYAMAAQSNGKILVAGNSYSGSGFNLALVRFKTNGEIDSTFGNQGIVITTIAGNDTCNSIVVQNDDKIVLVGNSWVNGSANIFDVVRYTQDGQLDSSFGNGGIAPYLFSFSDHEFGYAVTMQQPQNKIIIGGTTDHNGSFDFAMLRLDSIGNVDNTFGNNGIVLTDFSGNGSNDQARDILIQPDGRILLAGKTDYSGSRFAIARYSNNGIIDSSFGTSGLASISIASSPHECYSLSLDSNNRILAGGNVASSDDFVIVRFTSGLPLSMVEAEVKSNNGLSVYPNPASHRITISKTDLSSAGREGVLCIADINGIELYSTEFNCEEVTLDINFPKGIYIIRLYNDHGIKTQKLIIE